MDNLEKVKQLVTSGKIKEICLYKKDIDFKRDAVRLTIHMELGDVWWCEMSGKTYKKWMIWAGEHYGWWESNDNNESVYRKESTECNQEKLLSR